MIDIWNETIKIRDSYRNRTAVSKRHINNNNSVVHKADMLLRQMATAGGMQLMRSEVESFILQYKTK